MGKLVGKCFGCGAIHQDYDPMSFDRLCKADSCLHAQWPSAEHAKLVSILPEWEGPLDCAKLPPLRRSTDHTFLARWADDSRSCEPIAATDPSEYDPAFLSTVLPYPRDFLHDVCGLSPGTPVVYRSKRLQDWIWHQDVLVLDLASYRWSRTLKDPRTWAIMNCAVADGGPRIIAAWTAGNAGLSLAMLARATNHYLDAPDRVRVFALYDQFDESVDEDVRAALEFWDCFLLAVPSVRKEIFAPIEIRQKVRGKAVGLSGVWHDSNYWDVTDGWDGVGMVMYRLLMAQVVRSVRPTHIIAPLGTGNLILGVLLAVEDCKKAGLLGHPVTVIGAMPAGLNIWEQIRRRKDAIYDVPALPAEPPLMPKIATTYTPLVACIDNAATRGLLRPMEASSDEQRSAARQLSAIASGRCIQSEPSSVAAFAVLPKVANEVLSTHKADRLKERILVVNSGFGLLSAKERKFVLEHLGHA